MMTGLLPTTLCLTPSAEIAAEEWEIIHFRQDFLDENVYTGSCARADSGGEYYVPHYTGYPLTAISAP